MKSSLVAGFFLSWCFSVSAFANAQTELLSDPDQLPTLKPFWPAQVNLLSPIGESGMNGFTVSLNSEVNVLDLSGKMIVLQGKRSRISIPLGETDFLKRLEMNIKKVLSSFSGSVDSHKDEAPFQDSPTERSEIFNRGLIYLRVRAEIEVCLGRSGQGHQSGLNKEASLPDRSLDFPSFSGGRFLSVEVMDKMLGVRLWSEKNLWEEAGDDVAARLDWPKDSSTKTETTYRCYPKDGAKIFGLKPFYVALHVTEGKVRGLVIVFTNQFDTSSFSRASPPVAHWIDETKKVGFWQRVNDESWQLSLVLNKLLGRPCDRLVVREGLGDGWSDRWDWRESSLLLTTAPGRYTVLQVMPKGAADGVGRGLDEKSPPVSQVVRRKNGDVVVGGIPMVNQGQNDLCGAATWERYLQFRGMPADLYLLGVWGHAGPGGSLFLIDLEQVVQEIIKGNGHTLEMVSPELTIPHLARYLDAGLPLVWACNNPPLLEAEITKRSLRRKTYADWKEYRREALLFQAKYGKDLQGGESQAATPYSHLRLITGYNAETEEIAISDTYGSWAEERWMTLVEANAVSLGYIRVVR